MGLVPETSTESAGERLDRMLPLVTKPSRYSGHELNAVCKDHRSVRVRMALVYPDIYEIGMSHLGLKILYHVVNRQKDLLAERAFAPWTDLESRMREQGLPLLSLESRTPLKDFDVIGFTLPSELTFTNVLNVLDLSGIALRASDRKEGAPLVLGGGPCATNPEPLAPFFDAFVLGDGEEVILEIAERVAAWRERQLRRNDLLAELGTLPGVYVPLLFDSRQETEGGYLVIRPRYGDQAFPIRRRIIPELREEDFPTAPVVPFCEIEHDRFTIEVMRGCGRGCRFCHAGIYYRPRRCRTVESVVRLAREGIRKTGWEEVSLLSLSATDYTFLLEAMESLNAALCEKRVAVSLPSLRLDGFSTELAQALKRIKKTGLTFAVEAGTERLRGVIGKPVDEDQLVQALRVAFDNGWGLVKLYFMMGLPTEEERDLAGISELADRIGGIAKGKTVKLNLSPFVPKPHTPFQWEAQDSLLTLEEKFSLVRGAIRRKNVRVKGHDPRASKIEAVLARGDRRLAEVVEQAWRLGCRFDEWTECFSFARWMQAFEAAGIDPERYAGKREASERLPWDHLDLGLRPGFLLEDWKRSREGSPAPSCPDTACEECGVCSPGTAAEPERLPGGPPGESLWAADEEFGRRKRRLVAAPSLAKTRFRLRYRKGREIRFLSHLDLIRLLTRAMRRAELSLSFSEGFSPHPKVAFGPPLSLGLTSKQEYFDLQLSRPPEGRLPDLLNSVLPEGLEMLEARPILTKTASLSSVINVAVYCVGVDCRFFSESIPAFLDRSSIPTLRHGEENPRMVDIRPFILSLRENEEKEGIEMMVRIGNEGGTNPREVLRALTRLSDGEIAQLPAERIGLYAERGGRLLSPMDLI